MAKLHNLSPDVKRGEEALQKGDNAAAVRYFHKVLKKREDMTARNNLVLALYNTGDYTGAWEALQPNLELKGELPSWHPFSHALAAILLLEKGKESEAVVQVNLAAEGYEEALAWFEARDMDFDASRDYLRMMMLAAGRLGRHEMVVELGDGLDVEAMPPDCHCLRGMGLFNLEMYAQAAFCWRMAGLKYEIFEQLALVAELMEEEYLPPVKAEYTLNSSLNIASQLDRLYSQCRARGIPPRDALEACQGSRLLIMSLLFSESTLTQDMAFFMESLIRGYGDWGIEFGQAIRHSAAFSAPMKKAATATFLAMGLLPSGPDRFKPPLRPGKPPDVERAAWVLDIAMDKDLPLDAGLARCLFNMPALWLDQVCSNLGLKKQRLRRDREKQIYSCLTGNLPLLKALLDDLDNIDKLIMGFICLNDGYCPYNIAVLLDGMQGELHSLEECSPGTPVGRLISRGLLMAGRSQIGQFKRKVLVIPLELRPALQAYFQIPGPESAETADKPEKPKWADCSPSPEYILDLVSACAYFYGAIGLEDLYEQLNAREEIRMSIAQFQALVSSGGDCDPEDLLYELDNDAVAYFNAAGYRLILEEQMLQPGLPYRPISRAEALAVLEDREDELWSQSARNLEQWLRTRLGGSKPDQEIRVFSRLAIREIWQGILAGDEFNRAFKMLNDCIGYRDRDAARKARKLLASMWNDVPRWSLKGWSPSEILEKHPDCISPWPGGPVLPESLVPPADHESPAPQTPALKVGRNEPCPCGSGKKYKRCCGRNL